MFDSAAQHDVTRGKELLDRIGAMLTRMEQAAYQWPDKAVTDKDFEIAAARWDIAPYQLGFRFTHRQWEADLPPQIEAA